MKKTYNSAKDIFSYAKKLFPGGTQFLSKQPHRSGCENWPTYYTKAEGIKIYDYFNKSYLDFTQLGSGSSILGYNNAKINSLVINAINTGSMTSLNAPEEIDLAEDLLSLHKWGSFIKYARTGAEIVSIAIRIARTYKNKSKILFCGYHGWHDWYISSNHENIKNLDNHLFSDLNPYGVPYELKNTAIPFEYNNTDSFELQLKKHKDDLAAVIMEPVRFFQPNQNFLNSIKDCTKKYDIPLIYDEITSGWRQTIGGLHKCKKNTVKFPTPDIAVYSKSISNGFPFSCLVGSDKLFKSSEKTFISSTLWTEKIGTVAAIATINYFLQNNVTQKVKEGGKIFRKIMKKISGKHGYVFNFKGGIEALTFFTIEKNKVSVNKQFSEKMLEKGIMVTGAFYSTFAHKVEHYKEFEDKADMVLSKLEV